MYLIGALFQRGDTLFDTIGKLAEIYALLIFSPVTLIATPILLLRQFRKGPVEVVNQVLCGLHSYPQRVPGTVPVKAHVYQGILAWVQQTCIAGYFSPEEAESLLRRALFWNFTRGLFAYGGVLVPLVSLPEYFSQISKVRRNAHKIEERGEVYRAPAKSPDEFDEEEEVPAGGVRLGMAWTLLTLGGLAFVAAIIAAARCLVDDEMAPFALGMALGEGIVCMYLGTDLLTSVAPADEELE